MNSKIKAVLNRIERIEKATEIGREYLASGKNAHWHGFRPWFFPKVRNGKTMPPHKDWVKNVFLPRHERALRYARAILRRLIDKQSRLNDSHSKRKCRTTCIE